MERSQGIKILDFLTSFSKIMNQLANFLKRKLRKQKVNEKSVNLHCAMLDKKEGH